MIRFGVLGALQLTRDGEQLHVPTVKLRQLLALLLAQAGKGVSTDAIIDGLWDDRPPPTARRTVAAYVSRLRDLLGGEAEVESRPSGFAINVGAGPAGFGRV
jgi:DNA-binding SARP family transcriptional activator